VFLYVKIDIVRSNFEATLLINVQMFTNNLLKRPKLDAKRKKAAAYFNNKFPNSLVVEKSGFWTFNRVKILFSAGVALLAAWVVAFEFDVSGKAFLAFLGCSYILAPFICFRLNKYPALTKINDIKFIKVASRVYRQSELPSGIGLASIFASIPMIFVLREMMLGFSGSDVAQGLIFIGIFISPFFMYHLLCFIGDHPLAIFTSIRYLPARSGIGYNTHHSPQNSDSTSDYDYSCAPNGIPGQIGWDLFYSGYSNSSREDSSNTYHNS